MLLVLDGDDHGCDLGVGCSGDFSVWFVQVVTVASVTMILQKEWRTVEW